MNTKELLMEALELLKEGNNADASTKVAAAKDADADNAFEAMAEKLYSDELVNDEDIANKFKNLYSKHIEVEETPAETPAEKETVVVNNNNGASTGSTIIKWVVILIIVLVILYFLNSLFSFEMPSI